MTIMYFHLKCAVSSSVKHTEKQTAAVWRQIPVHVIHVYLVIPAKVRCDDEANA